jgi:hypothetical protein
MKAAKNISFWAIGVLSAACLLSAGTICGQAPPGPLPAAPSRDPLPPPAKVKPQKGPVQARTSIFGEWKLDPEDSDDAQKKIGQARSSGSSGGGNRRIGGGYPGGGLGGGRRGGSDSEDGGDPQKMRELYNPPGSLRLVQNDPKGPEIDVIDDQNHKLALFTDGRKVQKSKDPAYEEYDAHWDSNRLVTDEKDPHGHKMNRTYELSYDGLQLYETLHMTTGRSQTPLIIRYVFEPSGVTVPTPTAPAN